MISFKMLMSFVFVTALAKVVQAEELRFELLHQSDYDVKLEITEVVWYNHSYVRDFKLNLVWYNRTQRVHNGSLNLIADLSNDLTAHFQAYKFLSNEYRFFPLTVSINLCTEYRRNSFDAKTILDRYTNVRSCPIKKGSYYVRNAILNYSRWPPFLPRGAYKSVIKFYHNSNFLVEMHNYASIMDKPLPWIN